MKKSLTVVLDNYGHVMHLKSGAITLPSVELKFVDFGQSIISSFRKMVRNMEYDISEMPITTYLTAKRYGLPFTAIAAFPLRLLPQRICKNVFAGIQDVPDLEGKKVGVRAYTVTAGVCMRGFLATKYNLDLSKVRWILADEEHVRAFHKDAPKNAIYKIGANLDQLLRDGEVAAVLGAGSTDSPEIAPLIQNTRQTELEWCKDCGIYPINHTVVVRDEVLAEFPTLANELLDAMENAKIRWLEDVAARSDLTADEAEILGRRAWVGYDPLPYGVAPNKPTLEVLLTFLNRQRILGDVGSLEELFLDGTTG